MPFKGGRKTWNLWLNAFGWTKPRQWIFFFPLPLYLKVRLAQSWNCSNGEQRHRDLRAFSKDWFVTISKLFYVLNFTWRSRHCQPAAAVSLLLVPFPSHLSDHVVSMCLSSQPLPHAPGGHTAATQSVLWLHHLVRTLLLAEPFPECFPLHRSEQNFTCLLHETISNLVFTYLSSSMLFLAFEVYGRENFHRYRDAGTCLLCAGISTCRYTIAKKEKAFENHICTLISYWGLKWDSESLRYLWKEIRERRIRDTLTGSCFHKRASSEFTPIILMARED